MNEHYRPIAPAEPSAAQSSTQHGETSGSFQPVIGQAGSQAIKRRRQLRDKPSQNACELCRQTRSKCDGDKKRTCSRCSKKGLRCFFRPNTKNQKEEILSAYDEEKSQRETLSREYQSLSIILDVLINDGHVKEIIHRLQTKENPHSVVQWLLSLPELRQIVERNAGGLGNMQDAVARIERLYVHDRQDHDLDGDRSMIQWTTVTQNEAFIQHLFKLYFKWIHPQCMLFNKSHFDDGFRTGEDMYCSSYLVNAICAMAFFLLDRDTNESLQMITDYAHLGEAFLQEARPSFEALERPEITTIQATAVIFLVELSSNNAQAAGGLLRLAAEKLEELEISVDSDEVQEATRWGIHTLNTMWSALTFEKPANPQSPYIQIPLNFDFAGDQQELSQQYQEPIDQDPSFHSSVDATVIAVHRARLFRNVHGAINMYCGSRGKISAHSFLSCVRKYLDWREELPPALRIDTYKDHLLFPVFTLNIQYYTAMVVHWYPLLSFLTDGDDEQELEEEARSQLLENARNGVHLLRDLYSAKCHQYFTPPITFCCIHLCDAVAHWSTLKEEKVDAVRLCCQMLDEIRSRFRLCGPLLQLFRIVINQYADIDISDELQERYGKLNQYNISEVLNACTRSSYKMPVRQIVSRMEPNFGSQWSAEWSKQIGTLRAKTVSPSTSPTNHMRVQDLINHD